MIPVTTFAGQTVAVFGLGTSGNATALALMAGGANVAAWDDGAAGRASAEKAGIPLVDLNAADWSQFAALVLAPGVPLTHPEPHWTVLKARASGIEIIGDIELFCRERNKLAPDAPFIAITGTNGKSTTTALIAHILREAGKDVQMGGNIGVPILALEPPARGRYHVIEMSSFQIDLTPSVNPTIGVLLNITPDHLDRHGPADDLDLAMKNYAAIKERLIEASALQILGLQAARHLVYRPTRRRGIPKLISGQQTANIHVQHGRLRRDESEPVVVDLNGVSTLRGAHNGENAAAAFAVVSAIGLDDDTIARHLRTYPGLPHRMEEIGAVGDTLFINDSKATNADSTQKALLSFPGNIFWILGGKPKQGGITALAPLFPRITKAYLIGAATDEFASSLDGKVPYERCGTLDVAVAKAAADSIIDVIPAKAGIQTGRTSDDTLTPYSPLIGPGLRRDDVSLAAIPPSFTAPVVLLSPACASYDQFAAFEKRGDAFRALVHALPGFTARGGPKEAPP